MTCHENLKQFFRIFANIACFVMLVRGTKRPVACYWQRGVLPARALVHVANGGGVGLLTGHPSHIIVIDADRNAERLFKYPKLAQSCRVTRPNAPDRI
ncbi:MAG: hypothetical protein KDD44_12715, partial [Bdellovibrionales bacterium]|nr:hypothetical protein [Bdellovibrionales bacterium]